MKAGIAGPVEHLLRRGDAQLCAFEWGRPGGRQVLLAHATGFHARCWDQVVALLPQDWHVIALDMRGHGRSANVPPYSWDTFADDLLHCARTFEMRDAIGVGHSMGGHCTAHICAREPGLFRRLLLVDPVIFPPDLYAGERTDYTDVTEHPVARRKSHFSSWQEMHERLAGRHPYRLWVPEVFEDYCRYGVVPAVGGEGVDLACPGPVEAQVYMNNYTTDIFPLLGRIAAPVTILRAPQIDATDGVMDFASSPTWPELATVFANATDVFLPALTHFIPMQDPALVARHIVGD